METEKAQLATKQIGLIECINFGSSIISSSLTVQLDLGFFQEKNYVITN